jgi:hypothetical protein
MKDQKPKIFEECKNDLKESSPTSNDEGFNNFDYCCLETH